MGYIHVYTGNGKGKTTAAIGLAVRALYAGKKVYIGQFIKGMKYNEVALADDFDNITIEQYGETCMIDRHPDQKDIQMAKDGLEKIHKILLSNVYDIVIFDEITIAIYYKLFSVIELMDVLKPALERKNIELDLSYGEKRLGDVMRNFSDTSKAKRDLSWTANTELAAGIDKTIDWFCG